MKFFTSDYHFGHPSILLYCGRKYDNIGKMTDDFIRDANQKAPSQRDTIFHIGDFCNYGNNRGIPGSRIKATEYLKRFKAKVILLEGNHDLTNKVKTHMKCAVMDIGRWKNVTLGHYPSTYKESEGNFRRGTLRLCGHVHGYDSWRWCWDAENQILNINVGIDHWGHILSVSDVTVYADRVINRICLKNINWFNHLLKSCKRSFDSYVNQFPVGMPTHYCSGDRLKAGLQNQIQNINH